MKQTTLKKFIFAVALTVVLSACVLAVLMNYNQRITDKTATELGAIYMEEMMLQMQDHFSSILDVKSREVEHIAGRAYNGDDYRAVLCEAAESMDFEYIMLYDAEGNSETILGEAAWFRGMEEYLTRIEKGERAVTTGYLTKTGEKYLVFGAPAELDMESGSVSCVMLAGFSVGKLYEYINLDTVEQLGGKINMWIISTNGAYILRAKPIEEDSLFERLNNWGAFVGVETAEAISQIEKAMSGGKNFSYMVYIDGAIKHIFGSPAGEPNDWYFMITMPQGISDDVLMEQNSAVALAFLIAGILILLMLCGVFFVYYRNSTQQRRELERAWKEAEESRSLAENASMAKTFFLSNMSHDIRTPMNAIIGFTNLAMKENELAPVREYLKKISVSGDHLLLLINEILEMSRIESGKIVLDEACCSLTGLLEELHTVLGRKAEEKKLDFSIRSEIEDAYVLGDKRRLGQILINLTDNAVKYTMDGGRVSVLLRQLPCDKDGWGNYELVVADRGIGMSEEFVSRIFEPFEREHTSTISGIEGTGLGLSIVKHFVDMMGGDIQIDSKAGVGSVFTVRVCLRIAEAGSAVQVDEYSGAAEVYDEPSPSRSFFGRRILLVEDNAFNREIASAILEQAGFVVDTAENGELALQRVKDAAPDYYDVLLMDVQMPVMNGYEATRAIRALEGARAGLPIVAVTANAFESDREDVLAAGMDNYVTKPIDGERLCRVLREVLR